MTGARLRRALAAVAAVAVTALLVAHAATGVTAAPPNAPPPPGVDAKDCATCHKDSSTSLSTGGHAILLRSLGKQACDACHGPPGNHATDKTSASIVSFKSIYPDAIAEACARCHGDAPDHLRNWKTTPWAAEGKSCLDCHGVHDTPAAAVVFEDDHGRIGEEGCRLCHVDQTESMKGGIHSAVTDDPHMNSCETCHGSGALHVRAVHVDP
ncbi:MAG: hypothetical protein ACYTDX_02555, partial [Planctomycetota bacterium]